MPKFKIKTVRIVKEFDIKLIDADTEAEALRLVQDQEYPNVDDFEHLETLDETITLFIDMKTCPDCNFLIDPYNFGHKDDCPTLPPQKKVVINFHEGVFKLEEKPDGLEIILKEYIEPSSDFVDIHLKTDLDGEPYVETVL